MLRKYQMTAAVGRSEKVVGARPRYYSPSGMTDDGAACQSACAWAFLGARKRLVDDNQIGFHQFESEDASGLDSEAAFTGLDRLPDQYVVGGLVSYLIEMEINTERYPLVSDTPPDKMRVLTEAEAIALNVDNGASDAVEDWEILPVGEGLVIQAVTADRAQGSRLFCRETEPQIAHLQVMNRSENGSDYLSNLFNAGKAREYERYMPDVIATAGEENVQFTYNGMTSEPWNGFHVIFDFGLWRRDLSLFAGRRRFNMTAEVGIMFYHVRSYYWDFVDPELPLETDPRLIDLVLRNCG